MENEIYRYEISGDIPFREIKETMFLAILTTESVFGKATVRLDASLGLKREENSCIIDAGTEVGNHIARVFTGFLAQEFGDEAFKVKRIRCKPVDMKLVSADDLENSLTGNKDDGEKEKIS